ncbi:MAG: hypothetical protein KKD65_07960 [Gammaproteobacteria bacterium]|nr:hypothetical protein [Gammaproteobacteria bacterium]
MRRYQVYWREAPVGAKIGLMPHDFLRDFPEYFGLFSSFKLFEYLPLLVYPEDVKNSLGQIFNVQLTFHEKEKLIEEIKIFAPETAPLNNNLSGFMSRFGENFTNFFIAISFSHFFKGVVDRGTAIHEFGHFIEQKVATRKNGITHALQIRETSFKSANYLYKKFYRDIPIELAAKEADELIAWLNALWLCWLLKIDARSVVWGMIEDETNNSNISKFTINHLPKIKDFFLNRNVAEEHFKGKHKIGFYEFFEHENESAMCDQIDDATRRLIDFWKAPRLVSKNPISNGSPKSR